MADMWSLLPMLPLKHILDQLSLEDVLAATSTCLQWRHALVMYEGRRDSLKLNAKEPERSEFLAKLFKRNARKLHIYLDCPATEADEFLENMLHKFHDTALLQELTVAGPAYMKLESCATLMKIKRSTVENMLHAHRHTLQNVAFVGCELSTQNDVASGDTGELSGRIVQLNDELPAPLLSKITVKNMQFSSLQTLMLEYSTLDAELLESLCTLPHLSHLSLTLLNEKREKFEPLPWMLLENKPSPLEVTINIIGVPAERFEDIMEHVLVDNLPLAAIRVLFCKILHEPLIVHILKYDKTLKEFHWADSSATNSCGSVISASSRRYNVRAINPFILLCWRCSQLSCLTIHGYWIWQYDLLAMARLRHTSLQQLSVSATFRQQSSEDRFGKRDATRPIVGMDKLPLVKKDYLEQINQCLEFEWKPAKKLSAIHPALGPKSTEESRADYVLKSVMDKYGVT